MSNAVIVSTARTAFAKSWRGALNMTYGATMGGHVVQQAVARAGIDPGEVEDVLMGCALTAPRAVTSRGRLPCAPAFPTPQPVSR
jgi:acetyl-CoA acetyltransferase